jgi:hypothetical protein
MRSGANVFFFALALLLLLIFIIWCGLGGTSFACVSVLAC